MKLVRILIAFLFLISLVSIGNLSVAHFKKIGSNVWKGIASYYHPKFNGRKTATGEIFSNEKLTAANNFLSLGTKVKITNPNNGKSVVVKINDRMNANNKRLIDLSQAAAQELGLIQKGLGEVILETIEF